MFYRSQPNKLTKRILRGPKLSTTLNKWKSIFQQVIYILSRVH